MLKKYFTDRKKRLRQLGPIVGVLLIAIIGTYLLIGSHAASPYSSIPADQGTLTNGATSQSCTGAADGNCVTFGQSVAMDGNVALDFVQNGTPFAPTSFWNTPVPANVTLNLNSVAYDNEILNQICSATFSTAALTSCPPAAPVNGLCSNGKAPANGINCPRSDTSALNTSDWSGTLYVVPANQPLLPITDICHTSANFNNSVAGGVPIPANAHGAGGAYVPNPPTVTTQGTAGTKYYSYAVASVTASGTSTEISQSTGISSGNTALSTTNYNIVTWTPVAAAVQYKIYRTYSEGTPSSVGLIGTISAQGGNTGSQTFNDTGIASTSTTIPYGDTDEEVTIYQPSTNKEWEFWHFRKDSGGNWTACWGGGMSNVSTSDGVFPNDLGATATSLPLLGGIPRISEFRAGVINHVMNLDLEDNFYPTTTGTAPNKVTTYPANVTDPGNKAYSWPATRNDGGSSSTLAIPEGQRFILDPSLNLANYDTTLVAAGKSALTPFAMTMAVAAQKYGFVVVDSAGSVDSRIPDPTTYTTAGLPNPYTTGPGVGGVDNGNKGLFGGSGSVMANFPWQDLEALPFNYGEPSS